MERPRAADEIGARRKVGHEQRPPAFAPPKFDDACQAIRADRHAVLKSAVRHDGDLDLIARPWDDRDPFPVLFLNDGWGRFHQVPFAQDLPYLYYDFLDLDGDGGHDLVFATTAPPEEIYVIRDQAP